MNELINTAIANGIYNNLATEITSEAVVTALVDDLTITKTADRESWATGLLTYTVVIDNQSLLPYEALVFTDILDPALVSLVTTSIEVDSVVLDPTDYTYDALTGLLTIPLADLAPSSSSTITFQVEKK